MLSWVSGIHRSHQHRKPPSWCEHEIINNLEQPHREMPKRRLGLLPKLRKAIEAATQASNGSFPIQDARPPPSPGEETAFEACDSISQCSQSVGGSCSTQISYDMSRIDDDSITGVDPCDSVPASPTASDTDSLFGINIRDMATLECGEEKDDVWLLSAEDNVDVPPVDDFKSRGASILSRVPVLVLPGLSDPQLKRAGHSDNVESNAEEEEIEFGDSTFLINEIEEQSNLADSRDSCCDENRNGNIMMRAQVLGKNLKGIWSNSDCGKRVKLAKRRYQAKRRFKQADDSPCRLHSMDPLKELSKCHEKMMDNEQPFSPKRALSRIHDRIRGDPSDDTNKKHSVFLYLSSNSGDEASELSLPPGLFRGNGAREKRVGLAKIESSEGSSINLAAPVLDVSSRKPHSKTPRALPAYKIKFKSPRNDTPRIVLGTEVPPSNSGEEPRALYTDEGYVEAYIHPKGSLSCRSMDSRNSLNHVFHSDLFTLYEVSSSLESASFSAASGSAASTEATSMCATAGNPASSTTSDSSNNQETLENQYWRLPRQPNMPLMNMEEMSPDYVAEI